MPILRVTNSVADLIAPGFIDSTNAIYRRSVVSRAIADSNVNYVDSVKCLLQFPEAASDVTWFQRRCYNDYDYGYNNSHAHGLVPIFCFYDAQYRLLGGLRRISTTNFAVFADGDTVVNSAAFGAAVPTWTNPNGVWTFRVQVGASITVEFYYEGVLMQSATAANTGGKGKPVLGGDDAVGYWHYNSTSDDVAFSEYIVTDNEDPRGWTLSEIVPTTPGTYAEWVSNNLAAFTDADTGTGNSADANGERLSFSGPYLGGAGTIRSVIMAGQAARQAGSPNHLRPFARIGGVNYPGANIALGAKRAPIMQEWTLNPATGLPWTATDLASIEFGWEART